MRLAGSGYAFTCVRSIRILVVLIYFLVFVYILLVVLRVGWFT